MSAAPRAPGAPRRPGGVAAGWWLVGLGCCGVVAALAPPIGVLAREHVFVQAIQFSLLAFFAPCLVACGIALPSGPARRREEGTGQPPQAAHRRRATVVLLIFVVVSVTWRTPAAVDALRSLWWVGALEVLSLVGCGIALFLLLIGPTERATGRLTVRERPLRMLFAAIPMWATWIAAYALGFSSRPWYTAYPHATGRGLTVAADQQLAAGVLFAAAGLAFVPVVFSNLVRWLASQEDGPVDVADVLRQADAGWRPPA